MNFFACGACTQPEDGTFKALAFGLGVFMAITVSSTWYLRKYVQILIDMLSDVDNKSMQIFSIKHNLGYCKQVHFPVYIWAKFIVL